MIFELLGHVVGVVSMRNTVPCGISNAKESRVISVKGRIHAVTKWYSLARFSSTELSRASKGLITIHVTHFSMKQHL